MAKLPTVTSIDVESFVFPPYFKPPCATNTLFLGGAGVRCVEIEGKFVKVSVIGVYLEDKAIPTLAVKWKGKSAEELKDSLEFYRDITTGSFEKCLQVTTMLSLTGEQFSQKVSESCVGFWKTNKTYTDADDKIINKFLEVFKGQKFPSGSSILLTVSPIGSLMISFSKDGITPEVENVVLEIEKLGQAITEMVIGKNGVSPEAKQYLASRLFDLMN